MKHTVGIIGIGHFAGYLIGGFAAVKDNVALQLYSRNQERAAAHAALHEKISVFDTAQQAVDGASVVIVATRPGDVQRALSGVVFQEHQVVISVAAGVTLAQLQPLIGPATAVRALPIACVAINKSPIVMLPENAAAREVLGPLGQVHVLQDEQQFTAGTALVGAFYALMFPLMNHLSDWTAKQGLDETTARALVVETIAGASGMAIHDAQLSFQDIWTSLAVPGGISERGMEEVERNDGLTIWSDALDAVVAKLGGTA
ncbi:NAD(P)-binding domain-containing protein [Sulfitobacter sp. F26204]|uniref:pyrroline-5-carboxylate reductase dimerization domain-containing protein n=1 Tax=Sulfitobacter sp. F26204 TaxID=2996014 RepID=UPI00225E544D|nr:pyrroline-5-carboxylate reductase dimerization domain-containing protein [Sulfitobacter sp. F26204]MCX7561274.1 NAD(P)-binding domain-containing protein [Sulfitobacter sp. F26204]